MASLIDNYAQTNKQFADLNNAFHKSHQMKYFEEKGEPKNLNDLKDHFYII